MTPEQWARVKDVFHSALARDEETRLAFVADAAGDEIVRAEVERLLEADRLAADVGGRPAVPPFPSGHVVSHYEVGGLLGSGGMGRVYAARDIELGRDVALKVAAVHSPEAQARLRREAQHASRLSHPNICHIYDVGRADEQVFVVMERVEGTSLAAVLGEGPLTIADAKRYASDVADALAHAHERGVVHRDLKSTNVMITARGAKVLDFGLARMLDTHQIDALSHSQRSLTAAGMIAGTLPYLAPELLRGERGDHRADIWALGVLLYEMVGGRRPFSGATGFELSAAILHQRPATLPPSVPASMEAIIHRCLAKDPAERYQQAGEVRDALDAMAIATGGARVRLPIARRWLIASSVIAAGLAIAAAVAWRSSDRVESAFSNARGYSLLQDGEFDRAIEEFTGVVAREPADANGWDSLGEGYLANGMPGQAFAAYSRALTLAPTYEPSLLGRSLALAALGRYDEAFEKPPPDFRIHAFLLSRVGRYRAAGEVLAIGRRQLRDDDGEAIASAGLLSAWLSLERGELARALEDLKAAEAALDADDEPDHPLLVLSDSLAGIAEIRAGNLRNAVTRLEVQKARHDRDDRLQATWVAALDGEVALAQGDYGRAMASFDAARRHVWPTLGGDTLSVFATNHPSRDGRARVEIARGNQAAAILEYRRLAAGPPSQSAAALEPLEILALARLLEAAGDPSAARAEFARFATFWAQADEGLPQLDAARRALE